MPDEHQALADAINDLRKTVARLHQDLVRKDVYDAQRETDRNEVSALSEDVGEIKGTLTWLSRTLVASLLLPLASTIIIIYMLQGAG